MGGSAAPIQPLTAQPLPDLPTGLPRRNGPPPLPHERRAKAAEADRRRIAEEREAARRVKHEQRLARSSGGGLRAFVGVGALFLAILFGLGLMLVPGGAVSSSAVPSPMPVRDGIKHVLVQSARETDMAERLAAHELPVATDEDAQRPIVFVLTEVPRELLAEAERARLDRLTEMLDVHFDWRVVGEAEHLDLPDVDLEGVVADLRGAALMSNVGDELGSERLEGWLASHDALDAVLWVGFEGERITRHELLLDPDSQRFPRRLVERRRLVGSLRDALE
jgi:hypothetical protein